MKRYTLDTSALIAYIEKEDGYDVVESLIKQAISDEVEIFISIVSFIEVFYISWNSQGEVIANRRLELIEKFPAEQMPLEPEHIKLIGRIKSSNTISIADSCIAALAKTLDSTLVHKDPEFEQLEDEIDQLRLPYKPKTT